MGLLKSGESGENGEMRQDLLLLCGNNKQEVVNVAIRAEYTRIYDEVSMELGARSFTGEELFYHCMETCRKLFDIAEFKPGKPAVNIPDEMIDDIGALYDEKYGEIDDSSFPCGKYDYATSWDNFSDEDSISMYDLSMIIAGKPKDKRVRKKSSDGDNSAIDDCYNEIKKIYRNFLPKYFGYVYNDKMNDDEKYELIRLTKILYDCKMECGVDLGVLKRISLLQFRMDIPSSYQKAINFIKARIVLRRHDADCHLSFQNLIAIERYCSAVKNFIYSIPIISVNQIISRIATPTYQVYRYVDKCVYSELMNNMNELPSIDYDVIMPAEGIQVISYFDFLTKDIESVYDNDDVDKNIVVLTDSIYYAEDGWRNYWIKNVTYVNNIEEFVIGHVEAIVMIIYSKVVDYKDKKLMRKYVTRIKKHIPYYMKMMRIYNIGMSGNENDFLTVREVALLISAFETINDAKFGIPLYSGYSGGRRKRQKIKKLLDKIERTLNKEDYNHQLEAEEFFVASYWLFNYMHMVMMCQTEETINLMNEIRRKLYEYFKKNIPLLTNEGFLLPLDKIANKLLPEKTMMNILKEANDIANISGLVSMGNIIYE